MENSADKPLVKVFGQSYLSCVSVQNHSKLNIRVLCKDPFFWIYARTVQENFEPLNRYETNNVKGVHL